MSDPGLTRRLRQQSHRSGLAVGISMALAIGVCVVAFTVLYVKLDPWVRDFSGSEPAPTATAQSAASNNSGNEDPTEEPTAKPRATATEETGQGGSGNVSENDNNGDFNPDYQVTSLEAVNFRSGPGTTFDIVAQLDPGTQLEYIDDSQAATEPENAGVNWLKFRTESGDEGWIRDVDVGQT